MPVITMILLGVAVVSFTANVLLAINYFNAKSAEDILRAQISAMRRSDKLCVKRDAKTGRYLKRDC